MRPQDNTLQSQRSCARFFIFLAVVSVGLACVQLFNGRWAVAWKLVPGALFFGGIGWWGLSATAEEGPSDDDGGERAGDIKPLPVMPGHVRHRFVRKDLAPSEDAYWLARN